MVPLLALYVERQYAKKCYRSPAPPLPTFSLYGNRRFPRNHLFRSHPFFDLPFRPPLRRLPLQFHFPPQRSREYGHTQPLYLFSHQSNLSAQSPQSPFPPLFHFGFQFHLFPFARFVEGHFLFRSPPTLVRFGFHLFFSALVRPIGPQTTSIAE